MLWFITAAMGALLATACHTPSGSARSQRSSRGVPSFLSETPQSIQGTSSNAAITHYGQSIEIAPSATEQSLFNHLSRVGGMDCRLDNALLLAARRHALDLVIQQTLAPEQPLESPVDFLRFALRTSGVFDYTTFPFVFIPNTPEQQAAEDAMRRIRAPFTHCAVGIATREGQQQAVWLGVRRSISISPVSMQPRVGDFISIRGRIRDTRVTDVDFYLETPSGTIEKLTHQILGRQFSVRIPISTSGYYLLEFQTTTAMGPESAALLHLWAGVPAPNHPTVLPDLDPGDVPAETVMTTLVNRARRRRGLGPLERDERLDAIARSHCRDMVESRFFGHFSPHSGSLKDRLERQDLYPAFLAENIAQSSSLIRVHRNLLESPSHKLRIMSPQATHLGIGLVETTEGILVTQVFVKW